MRAHLLLACAALAAAAPAAAQSRNPYFDAGLRLYADFEYEAALVQLRKASAFPGNTPAEDVQIALYTGVIEFELGDAAGAESRFKTALALDLQAQLPAKVSPKAAQLFEKAKGDLLKARPPAPVAPQTATAADPVNPPEPPLPALPAVPAVQPVAVPAQATTPATSAGPAAAPGTQVATIQPGSPDVPRAGPAASPAPTGDATLLATPVGATQPVAGPETPKPSGGRKVLAFALLGVGAGLAGGGGFFGLQSRNDWGLANSAGFQSDAAAYYDSARTEALAANLLFAAATGAAIAGVVTLLTDSD